MADMYYYKHISHSRNDFQKFLDEKFEMGEDSWLVPVEIPSCIPSEADRLNILGDWEALRHDLRTGIREALSGHAK